MHRGLNTTDVLIQIIGEVDNVSRNDTLSLVLTCRQFKNYALPLLWKCLETPAPLFMTMPRDLWEVDVKRYPDLVREYQLSLMSVKAYMEARRNLCGR